MLVSGLATAQIRIVALGDSITAGMERTPNNFRFCNNDGSSGFGVECFGRGVVNRGAYLPQLANLLRAQGETPTIYNWGVSGERTNSMAGRISSLLTTFQPDFVTIMGGANDAYSNFSAGTTYFNVDRMITFAELQDVIPVVATVTPNLTSSSLSSRVQSYNAAIRQLVEERNVALADQYGALISNFSANQSGDFLHINGTGNIKMAAEWNVAIVKARAIAGSTAIAPIISLLLD